MTREEREQREKDLEQLLERYTEGQEPLQKALTIIKFMRNACQEDKQWMIEVTPERYRVIRRPPL
jgi:hypothetical protein